MRKLISILLTLCLLLTPVLAQAETVATQISLEQIGLRLGANAEPIELGLRLLLTTLTGDEGVSLLAAVQDEEDQALAAAGLVLDENGLTGIYDGMTNSYRLSMETLTELVTELESEIEDELGMPLQDVLTQATTSVEQLQDTMTASLENCAQTFSQVFAEAEGTYNGMETVTVLGDEYSLESATLSLSQEQCAQILAAFEQVLLDVQSLYPEQVELDLSALEGLGATVDMRICLSEDETVVRYDVDLNLTWDGETLTLPFVLESVNNGEDGIQMDMSMLLTEDDETVYALLSMESWEEEDVWGQDYLLGLVYLQADGTTESIYVDLGILEDTDGIVSYTLTMDVSDDEETYEIGGSYSYTSTNDGLFSHDAYVDLWMNGTENGQTVVDYEVDFLLSIQSFPMDASDLLVLDDSSILDVEQMTDEQAEQAVSELADRLQSLWLGLMNDTGVQQLITLLGGAE